MEENKEKIEQFETDETEEKKKKEERKKSKKRFWKRIKNLALVIIFFGAIYLIVIRSRQIQSLQKKNGE